MAGQIANDVSAGDCVGSVVVAVLMNGDAHDDGGDIASIIRVVVIHHHAPLKTMNESPAQSRETMNSSVWARQNVVPFRGRDAVACHHLNM